MKTKTPGSIVTISERDEEEYEEDSFLRGTVKGKKKTIDDPEMYQAGRATMRTSSNKQSEHFSEDKEELMAKI